MNAPRLSGRPRRRGFTLVEIMIVVVIIGLLAAFAIPALSRVKTSARAGRLVSDLRTFAQAFETYATTHGTWPGDGTPSVVPAGMSGDFSKAKWTAETSVGGQWDWDYQQFGFTAGISVTGPRPGPPRCWRSTGRSTTATSRPAISGRGPTATS